MSDREKTIADKVHNLPPKSPGLDRVKWCHCGEAMEGGAHEGHTPTELIQNDPPEPEDYPAEGGRTTPVGFDGKPI